MKCSKCQSENPDSTNFCGTCGTPLGGPDEVLSSATKTLETQTRRLAVGTVFAERYEVLAELGKGGMGVVYRVRDKKLDEEMALKVLKPEIAAHRETVERFMNELKFARKIAHRNVCKMYDLNEGEKIIFITMEYVKGQDLKNLIRERGKFTEKAALETAKQVCEGLAEAHALGVIHRDLKPQNIMMDEKGAAKVMDFGIARSIEAPGMTQTGMMIGTPDYISPEQAEGEKADQRSDIYSLGAILYEMVTGKLPFRGDTALSVAIKHKTQTPHDPRELNPQLSPGMGRLILKCMEKDPGRRYQTAKEVLADLDRIEKGLPIAATALTKRLRIPWRKVLPYAVGAGLTALIVFGALSLFKPRVRSLAVLPFRNLTGDANQDYFVDEIADDLITHLGRIGSLRVISFTSSFQYKGVKKSLPEIARELNADAIVEGAVQQVGDNVSLSVRLVKARPEEQSLWEGSYSRTISDTLVMYGDIARAISQKINVKLTPQAETHFMSAGQIDPETYKAYLRGCYLLNFATTDDDINKGLAYFRQAIAKDPANPWAYAGLGYAYVSLGHGPASPPDAWQQARAAAERALKLDENMAEGYAILADVKTYYERDWMGAEQNFKRAMELNPSLPWNHYHYAWYLVLMGRLDESIKEHTLAAELDPMTPWHTAWLGVLYFYKGQYDKGLEEARKCLKQNDKFAMAWVAIGWAYQWRGKYKEAIEAHEKAAALDPSWKYVLGQSYALSGRKDEALKIVAELEKAPNSFDAWALATLYSALGDRDKAFKWLAYEPAHAWIPWVRIDPQFFPLRGDPRFRELLRKYNLPDVK
ncbi:MAG: protein kinase [Candidatus Aminicenantes bacterium]|nr:protein kinase [Candidatus Aminicenantes bacterium]